VRLISLERLPLDCICMKSSSFIPMSTVFFQKLFDCFFCAFPTWIGYCCDSAYIGQLIAYNYIIMFHFFTPCLCAALTINNKNRKIISSIFLFPYIATRKDGANRNVKLVR